MAEKTTDQFDGDMLERLAKVLRFLDDMPGIKVTGYGSLFDMDGIERKFKLFHKEDYGHYVMVEW